MSRPQILVALLVAFSATLFVFWQGRNTRSPIGMSSTKAWADGPLKLITTPLFTTKKNDIFTVGASHMAQMHNSIFRGYNSIYLQAPHVADGDKKDFIQYALAWYKLVETHAANEEANLFPMTEKLLDDTTLFAETHKEHDEFLPAIAKFQAYLISAKAKPIEFSGPKLLEVMDAFVGPFEAHFRSEIDTIAAMATHPNSPKEGSPQEKRALTVFDNWGRNSVVGGGMTDVVPVFFFNLDKEYEEGLWTDWPPVPTLVRRPLVAILGTVGGGKWRFASCDGNGKRRELYAVPEGGSQSS